MTAKFVLLTGFLVAGTLTANAQRSDFGSRIENGRRDANLTMISSKRLRSEEKFCLGSDVYSSTQVRISEMEGVRLQLNARSIFDRTGNRLKVMDEAGSPLRYVYLKTGASSYEIPMSTETVVIDVLDRSRDICLAGSRDVRLENFSISYLVGRSGPGPRPPEPRNYEAAIGGLSPEGEVFGWACDPRSRSALNVALYANNELVGTMPASINIEADGRNRQYYGRPSAACGSVSGYRFRVNLDRAGKTLNLELRASEGRRDEASIARRQFTLSVGEGIFNVGSTQYFATAGTYCHIPTTDQLTARIATGYPRLGSLDSLPSRMRDLNICKDISYPKSLFKAVGNNRDAIYLSDGDRTYCHVHHPGMLDHIKGNTGLRNVTEYQQLPPTMTKRGVCRVAGFFRVRGGTEVYESKGGDTYCHVQFPESIGRNKVYNYEDFPAETTKSGLCGY